MQIFFLLLILFFNSSASFSQSNPGLDQLKKTAIPIMEISVVGNEPILSKETYLRAIVTTHQIKDGTYFTQIDSTEIKGRGNSSWTVYPKKPYRLKLYTSRSMLGMPSNRHWALIANYIDRTLIRNKTAYDLSKIFGLKSASKSEMVHLILNSQYQGVYQFTEVIKIGKDRVDIEEIKSTNGDVTGGVILEVSDILDEVYNFQTDLRNVNFSVKDPDDLNTNNTIEAQKRFDYVKNILNRAESALFSENFQDTSNGYSKYFDVQSLVNWYLLEELFRNIDAEFRRSVYMYIDTKNSNRITMGPVWDFDISSGVNTTDPTGYWIKEYERHWYSRLFQDSTFKKVLKANWNKIRSSLHHDLYTIINNTSRRIYKGQQYNFNRWEYVPFELPIVVFENHDQEVFYLKKYLKERIEWLDGEFEYNQGGLPPITSDLHFEINEDEKMNIQLKASGRKSDTDYFEIIKRNNNSSLNLDKKTGSVEYTPNLNFYGSDTVGYRYFDGKEWSDTSYLYIHIEPINDELEVTNTIIDTLLEDTEYSSEKDKGLFSNISDPDDKIFKIDAVGSLKISSIIQKTDGAFTYIPNKNANGKDTLEYTVINESNQSTKVSRIFHIKPVNDAPELSAINKTIDEDTQLKLTIDQKYIIDPDDTIHQITISRSPLHGKATISNENQLMYVPKENFYGIDSFKIKAKDNIAFSNENAFFVSINPVDDKPIAIKELFYQVRQDDNLKIQFEDFYTAVFDPDADTLNVIDFIDADQDFLIAKKNTEFVLSPKKFTLGVIKKKVSITDLHSDPIQLNIILRVLPNPKQHNFESIKIFPNPTSNSFTIDNLQINFIKIYNSIGKLSFEKKLDVSNKTNLINITNIAKGTYRVVLYNNNEVIAIKTLIVI